MYTASVEEKGATNIHKTKDESFFERKLLFVMRSSLRLLSFRRGSLYDEIMAVRRVWIVKIIHPYESIVLLANVR